MSEERLAELERLGTPRDTGTEREDVNEVLVDLASEVVIDRSNVVALCAEVRRLRKREAAIRDTVARWQVRAPAGDGGYYLGKCADELEGVLRG